MLERLPWSFQLLLAIVVMIAGYYDLRWRRIPNWLTFSTFFAGFAMNAFVYSEFQGIGQALLRPALGFGLAMLIYFPLYLLRGMGAGDVKLMAAVGALVGPRDWFGIFVLSAILGGVFAVILMMAKGRARKTIFNTGYIVWEMAHFRAPHLKNEEFDVSNPRALTLPHGAAIALGSLLFLGLQAVMK